MSNFSLKAKFYDVFVLDCILEAVSVILSTPLVHFRSFCDLLSPKNKIVLKFIVAISTSVLFGFTLES